MDANTGSPSAGTPTQKNQTETYELESEALKLKRQQTSETSELKPNKHDSYEDHEAELRIGLQLSLNSPKQTDQYKNEEVKEEVKPSDAQSLSQDAIKELNLSEDIIPSEQIVIFKYFTDLLKSAATKEVRTKSESGLKIEHRNIHILMRYLQSENQASVIQFLIHQLSKETKQNLDLYLPQICYLVITKTKSESLDRLKKFIVEISIENANLGLRALHYFQSWCDDEPILPYHRLANEFFDILEISLVNQSLPKQLQTESPKQLEMEEYLDKQFKEKYLEIQRTFLKELRQFSINLKEPSLKQQPQGQDKMLHGQLRSINDFIIKQVNPISEKAQTKETQAKYKGGIVLPFDQGDDVDPWVILRCIPELAQIFETKMRTPFKVVFEVCKLSELKGEYVQKPQSNTVANMHTNFGESGGTGGNMQS